MSAKKRNLNIHQQQVEKIRVNTTVVTEKMKEHKI